jgi:hypothetical protein
MKQQHGGSMSNRSRGILCRAAFLTFCLLPTLALAGWIVNERIIAVAASPVVETDARPLAEAELSRLLGLAVTLDRISYVGGATVLEGMTIADPETGARIAQVPVLEMARGDNGLVMTATRPEIDAERWPALWETLHNRVLRERGEKMPPIDLTASQATLVSGAPERSPTFTGVQVRLESGKASIEFRLAGAESSQPARFAANRDRSASPPVTRWELHTGEGDFPCAFLADHTRWLSHLGEKCAFNGSLWCEEAAEGWRGEAIGRLNHVDLDRLVSDCFPQVLSGEANITLNRAEFANSRLRAATGAVEAGPGTIGRRLLGAAYEHLGLRNSPQIADAVPGEFARYGRLKLGFAIDETGLQLSGACDGEGTILSLENDPLARLFDQPRQVVPVVSLIRVLAPASDFQVAASQETEALLRVLPLPAIKPAPATAAAPQARARLQE